MQFNGNFNIDDAEIEKRYQDRQRANKWDKWLLGLGSILGANLVLTFGQGGALSTIGFALGSYAIIKFTLHRLDKSNLEPYRLSNIKMAIFIILVVSLFAIPVVSEIYRET